MAHRPPSRQTLYVVGDVDNGALKSAQSLYDQMVSHKWHGAGQITKMVRNMLNHLEDSGYPYAALDREGVMSDEAIERSIDVHTALMLTETAYDELNKLFDPAYNTGYQDPGEAADNVIALFAKADELMPLPTPQEQQRRQEQITKAMQQGADLMLARAKNAKRPENEQKWRERYQAYCRKIANAAHS